MKTIRTATGLVAIALSLALVLLVQSVSSAPPADNQWLFQKKNAGAPGFTPYGVTTIVGRAFGLDGSGNPAMLNVSGGGGLENILSSITGDTLNFTGTLTAPRDITWRDLAGTVAFTSDLSAYLTTSTAASTYAPLSHNQAWSTITSTPTTLAGYGIADAITAATAASSYQPLAANLTWLSSSMSLFSRTLLDDISSSAMRTTLGLGSLATQPSSAVAISGGSIYCSGSLLFVVNDPDGIVFARDVDGTNKTTTLRTKNTDNIELYWPTAGTDILSNASLATTSAVGAVELATDGETAGSVVVQGNDSRLVKASKVEIGVALSDETTALTSGTAKVTFRMPHAMTLTAVRLSLSTASASGTPTVDINESGTTILSTKLSCDATEKTSTTAATAAVISDTALADDAEITLDIDDAATAATGAKIWLIGTRN